MQGESIRELKELWEILYTLKCGAGGQIGPASRKPENHSPEAGSHIDVPPALAQFAMHRKGKPASSDENIFVERKGQKRKKEVKVPLSRRANRRHRWSRAQRCSRGIRSILSPPHQYLYQILVET